MEMVQKTAKARKTDTEEVPAQTQQEAPQSSKEASSDAEDVLDLIDCCLAENELDSEKELKAQGKAEYEALMEQYNSLDGSMDAYDEWWVQYRTWKARYAHVFEVNCCGTPIFDD